MAKSQSPERIHSIAGAIFVVRGHRVLLDSNLAALYGVDTRVLLQAVRRNRKRFPDDFMFQLTATEWASLRSQSVILKSGRGQHSKYLPCAFTEHGVAMLSSVLSSDHAIAVNIQIMRTFVRMRGLLISDRELAQRLDQLKGQIERKFAAHDRVIARSPASSLRFVC